MNPNQGNPTGAGGNLNYDDIKSMANAPIPRYSDSFPGFGSNSNPRAVNTNAHVQETPNLGAAPIARGLGGSPSDNHLAQPPGLPVSAPGGPLPTPQMQPHGQPYPSAQMPGNLGQLGRGDLVPGGALYGPNNAGGMWAGRNAFQPTGPVQQQQPQPNAGMMADQYARFDPMFPGQPRPDPRAFAPPGHNATQPPRQLFPGEPDPDHMPPFQFGPSGNRFGPF